MGLWDSQIIAFCIYVYLFFWQEAHFDSQLEMWKISTKGNICCTFCILLSAPWNYLPIHIELWQVFFPMLKIFICNIPLCHPEYLLYESTTEPVDLFHDSRNQTDMLMCNKYVKMNLWLILSDIRCFFCLNAHLMYKVRLFQHLKAVFFPLKFLFFLFFDTLT